jgi:hypothetical protein
LQGFSRDQVRRGKTYDTRGLTGSASKKCGFADQSARAFWSDAVGPAGQRNGQQLSIYHLNQIYRGDTKPSVRQDVSRMGTSHLKGKFEMKLFCSSLFGQAIKAAAVSAALMLSVSAGHAQSRPFAGFDGAWSGNGTVSLSDGSTERIRCRADYKVNGTGQGLKQSLRCASDSYKFDLSSDVTSQGERISGNWSEASRNIFGNLQGTAGGGKIDVLVEAPGFTASLMLRTNGNRQTVQISSKGDIKGVSITMVRS